MASIGNLPVPWAGYYFFPTGMGVPDPPEKPKDYMSLLKEHEEAVEKVVDAMPEVEQLIFYKLLYARNVRIVDISIKIDKLLKAEAKAKA